ncbi:4Fe-4S binding protein [bacterium]|nr:4Fe-4S binding protein [bacterium]
MLRVKRELCISCSLCMRICLQGAITLVWGKAWINQSRCISCYRCYQVCPRGAIQEDRKEALPFPVPRQSKTASRGIGLKNTDSLSGLKEMLGDVKESIEKISKRIRVLESKNSTE